MAAGGGGSSGFGGGGGGGGGFGGGGGGFGGSGGGGSDWWMDPLATVIAYGFIAFMMYSAVVELPVFWRYLRDRRGSWRTAASHRKRREKRAKQTTLAAFEAAEDDAHFAPEVVEPAAVALFVELQSAWDARDHDRLRALTGTDLHVEWTRRLADFAAEGRRNRVKVTHAPTVSYLGIENRADDAEDRVVVFIECRLEDYLVTRYGTFVDYRTGENSKKVWLREYWTLAWTPGGWRIDSIQGEKEGEHHLEAPLVASPWSDEGRLGDEALVEGAVADAAPAGAPAPGELVDVDYAADARAAALDLSLVDGRFAPAVMEAAVRRAVPAWVAAIDGADDQLLRVATPSAARALLYPDPGHEDARLVLRGGAVEDVRITILDTDAEPARMTVAVTLRGRRYVEDRATAAVLSGSRDRETTSTERLLFALDGADPAVPWRIVGPGPMSGKPLVATSGKTG